jgi:hypothetical protein
MFPNNPAIIDRLARSRQEEIKREIHGQRYDPTLRNPGARPRLGRLIGLLVAAGWMISFLI